VIAAFLKSYRSANSRLTLAAFVADKANFSPSPDFLDGSLPGSLTL
jgi:hypothetical protein